MQTPIRQKRPNFRISHFRPSKCRPCTVPSGARAPPLRPLSRRHCSYVTGIYNRLTLSTFSILIPFLMLPHNAVVFALSIFSSNTHMHTVAHTLHNIKNTRAGIVNKFCRDWTTAARLSLSLASLGASWNDFGQCSMQQRDQYTTIISPTVVGLYTTLAYYTSATLLRYLHRLRV